MHEETMKQPTISTLSILRGGSLALALLGLVKFVALFAAAGFDPAMAPWFFLAVFVVPFVIGAMLVARAPRGAAVLLGVFSLGFLAFLIGAVAQNGLTLEHWSDYLVLYVGAPISAAVIVAAVQTARRGARSAGTKTSIAR